MTLEGDHRTYEFSPRSASRQMQPTESTLSRAAVDPARSPAQSRSGTG